MKSLITGITGQDGGFLTKYLLERGEQVIGLKRRTSTNTLENIRDFLDHPNFSIVEGDVTDYSSIFSLLFEHTPDCIYNLAAQSHVTTSFSQPFYTTQVNYIGQLNLLESLRALKDNYTPKLYFACHDKETKILTPNGIKSYDEVSVGDLVYSINENTREIEIKPIINKINYHYKGDMVGIKSRRINQLVTPNHKVLFCDDTDLIKDDASNLTNYIKHSSVSKYSMPVGKHYGKKNDDIILETSKENHSKNIIDKIDCYSYALIMGLYLGDGYIKSKKYKTRNISRSEFRNNRDDSGKFKAIKNDNYTKEKRLTSRIEFAIPENDKARNLICSLFDSLGFEYGKNDTIVWLSCYGLSKKLLEDCGIKFDGKFIPEWVYDYDIKFLQNLLKGLLYSDGDADRQYFTSNEKLMTDVVRLVFSLGYYPSVNKRDETVSWYAKENRYIRSTTPRYNISIGFTGKNKIYSNHIQKKYYNDLVWCLEVEDNHNFLIIRDGKIAFSGNCTSETFGKNYDLVEGKKQQGINTEFAPQSPYGVAKLAAFHLTRIYREAYGIFACSGILHNHESEYRGELFLTRKVTKYVAELYHAKEAGRSIPKLQLGNLDAYRDWSYAGDMVRAMHLILSQPEPADYVVSSDECHSVREFVELAFKCIGENYLDHIEINPKFFRPAEVDYLCGDSKEIRELGWQPEIDFKQLVTIMVEADIARE